MTSLSLPWPPTTGNHQHARARMRRGGWRIFVVPAVSGWRAEVACIASVARVGCVRGDVRVTLDLSPPDKRRRDADNVEKVVFDALVRAGVIEDDSRIREHTTRWCAPTADGGVEVRVEEVREVLNEADRVS